MVDTRKASVGSRAPGWFIMCSARLGLVPLTPLYAFVWQESDLCFWHLSREFDSRVKVICLFHDLSSLFCLVLCSTGKTHRQYIYTKTAIQLPWVPRDFLCALSCSVTPPKKLFFLAALPLVTFVEGLNVTEFCPKCNKVVNVTTICPKCNKFVSCLFQ